MKLAYFQGQRQYPPAAIATTTTTTTLKIKESRQITQYVSRCTRKYTLVQLVCETREGCRRKQNSEYTVTVCERKE